MPMPRIDPLKLLECLKILLSPSGGIKSSAEVTRLANLMTKFSKKLVSKCIYIEILKCSDTELLCQFMQAGGWTLVHLWLTDAITSQNWPLVHEILELLLLCPVDVERLKSNTAPRLVKQLTKDDHPNEVKLLAETLVQQWLRIVRGEALPSGNTSASELTSENENSQDVPATTNNNESKPSEEGVPVEQKKIVLKLSVKDGKNVIIKRNDEEPEAITEKSSTVSNEETASIVSESKSTESENQEQPEKEKKEIKEKKKSSSSTKSSSSSHKSSSHKSSSSSSSSSKHKSSSSKDKDKDKDRHKSNSHHHKSSSSSKSSSSKSSSRSEREKKKDKEPEMSEADKVAKTLAELEPEKLTKLGKIPKKPRDPEALAELEKKTSKPVPAPSVPKVKPTFSIEERDPEKKAKTVKTLNSKFRSHGLEEEAPPPPSRKGLKKPEVKPTSAATLLPAALTTGIKRVSPPRTSIGKDPALSPPIEKKPKLMQEDRPNGLKLSSKPKSHTLVETDLFSDALNMESTSRKRAIDAKKRKRRLSGSEKTPPSPTTTTPTGGIPMKFYQDTLSEDGDEKKSNKGPNSPDKDDAKDEEGTTKKLRSSTSLEEASPGDDANKEEDTEMEVVEKKPPGIGTGENGPPGILKVFNSRSKKKSITWRSQEELVEIRYFELDVTERVNVNRQFSECRQADMLLERQTMMMARNLPKEDLMEPKMGWAKLREIDGVPKLPMGEQSTERQTQLERERTVLPALPNLAMLPNSPMEPDPENVPFTEPKIIPIDDLTGNPEAVNDFTHMLWPESKGEALNNPSTNNLNNLVGFNQFPGNGVVGAASNAAPNPFALHQPPSLAGPWATAPPSLLNAGAIGQPPPFVDPTIHNPLAAFSLPGNQFMAQGILNSIPNNFGGPPPPANFNNQPERRDNNWVRGNADRNRNRFDNRNDRDRRHFDNRDRRDERRDRSDRGFRPGECRQFVKFGNCRQGDKCIYYHPAR
uniref:CSON007863 protein n=1 Tax=Culicoides sonorensis TaxID=179676 RepID=A0A336LXZ9_CULSO